MKKLMIAAAIVCAAVASQAATFDWKTNNRGGSVVGPDGKALAAATAYLFESTAASSVLDAWAKGETWTTGNKSTGSMTSAGAITGVAFEQGDKGVAASITAIFALAETIDGKDYLYISGSQPKDGKATGTTTITFAESQTPAVFDAAKGFQGAGWYTQSVPEPTSGLLLLLGVAGLALKRRRA